MWSCFFFQTISSLSCDLVFYFQTIWWLPCDLVFYFQTIRSLPCDRSLLNSLRRSHFYFQNRTLSKWVKPHRHEETIFNFQNRPLLKWVKPYRQKEIVFNFQNWTFLKWVKPCWHEKTVFNLQNWTLLKWVEPQKNEEAIFTFPTFRSPSGDLVLFSKQFNHFYLTLAFWFPSSDVIFYFSNNLTTFVSSQLASCRCLILSKLLCSI